MKQKQRWWAKKVVRLFLPAIIRLRTILYHALYQVLHIFRPLPKQRTIDFTTIEWDAMDYTVLQFLCKEAVEFNESLLEDINRLSQKGFHLLALALTVLSIASGLLLSFLEKDADTSSIHFLSIACVGLGVVTILLLVSIFPRSIYRGRATPDIFFSSTLYKCPMSKIMADSIAVYHNKYITGNYKVLHFRSSFLTSALIVFIGVVLVTTILAVYRYFLPN
ncbi:MAG: hypothetical protein LBF75_08210 [Treponema sp.]|jgi:hypothetical protein|nr:hypothetical protein [Treponema sp.]